MFLAFDLGTSALRGGLVTGGGTTILQTSVPIRDNRPSPESHEGAPQTWWRALRRTAAQLLDHTPSGQSISGICIGGATRAQVFLDAKGNSLGPALLFRDRRAVDEAREIAAYFPGRDPADAISAFHPLARIAWFRRHAPDAARLRFVCEPKDYLNFRLTGRIAADSVTYSRYDGLVTPDAVPDWLGACLDRLYVERVDPWGVLGPNISTESPFEQLKRVPVLVGAMDAWMAAIGAGAATPQQGYDIAGTSEVVGQITAARAEGPGLVSLRWTERAFHLGGPTQAGAASAAWAYQNLRVRGRLAEAVERAASIAPRLDLPLFLPYLAGERTPVWRADLRAAFHGVCSDHSGDDLLWAVLEGVALAGRDILDHAVYRSGEPVTEVRIAGGGARSDAWCQLKADVLGVPVIRTVEPETGLTGAGATAAVGVGHYPNVAAAVTAMSKIGRVFTPRAVHAALFAERAVRYANAKAAALAP